MDWIDIPEVQLMAVMILGLFSGWATWPYLKSHPFIWVLTGGLAFFAIRFVPAYMDIDVQGPHVIPGNGIISAAIMWVVFFACILLGHYISERRYDGK